MPHEKEMEQFAIKYSREHWDRMINWAMEKDPDERVSPKAMSESLGETWAGLYCNLCFLYSNKKCKGCPMNLDGAPCSHPTHPWRKVSNSKTWGEWLIYAKQIRKILEVTDGEA